MKALDRLRTRLLPSRVLALKTLVLALPPLARPQIHGSPLARAPAGALKKKRNQLTP
jgi:hypothetical protein